MREMLMTLSHHNRAEQAGTMFVATVGDFIEFLEERERDGLLLEGEGIYSPLRHANGLYLLYPDGSAIPAPRTWDLWAMVRDTLKPDERRNPLVVKPKEMPPLACPACGQKHVLHDGVLLRCDRCSWTRMHDGR